MAAGASLTRERLKASLGFEPANLYGRLIFQNLAEISDAGIELHHCAGGFFDWTVVGWFRRSQHAGSRRIQLFRAPTATPVPALMAQVGQ